VTHETAPPGWYHEDPSKGPWRFWDGDEWTPYRSQNGDEIEIIEAADPKRFDRKRLLLATLAAIVAVALIVWLRAEPATNSIGF